VTTLSLGIRSPVTVEVAAPRFERALIEI